MEPLKKRDSPVGENANRTNGFTVMILGSVGKIRSFNVSIPIVVSVIFFTAWFGFADKEFKKTILSIVSLPKQTIAYVFEDSQTAYGKVNRLPTWRNAISKFMDNPIFGIGYGSEYYNDAGNYIRRHPHSIFLQFLAETGVIGLGTFLVFIGMVFRKAILNYRKLQNSSDKLAYLLYPMSFVFFLLFSFFHFAIHENYFFWYFAGMIVGFEPNENSKSLPRNDTELHGRPRSFTE